MVAGYTALTVRKIVQTQLIPAEPMSKPSPFATLEFWAWGAVFVASLPSGVKKVLHPIICCALSADLAAIAYGYLSRSGVDAVLGDYLTKAPSNPGAGDVLMGFLGSVIISFAFSMFKQRKLVKRHAAEIFTSIAIASTFSLYSTAILGRVIGLEPSLTISILPRCITVALALSIVSFFEGVNSSLTAAVVVLTGLIGANFVQAAMDKLGLNDPIARGIGTASSAHGLGTAALSAKEPEALPFCAIAYGLTGIFGSLICSVPAVRQSLSDARKIARIYVYRHIFCDYVSVVIRSKRVILYPSVLTTTKLAPTFHEEAAALQQPAGEQGTDSVVLLELAFDHLVTQRTKCL
uniref:LrgB-like family protein n=1 Tax=Oryza glumipatula TaxID=40148 RepID=A0A0D9Y9G2_9ORYZ